MNKRTDDRPGQMEMASEYDAQAWREKSIRARRFLPCPHCGGTVSARERIWMPPWHARTTALIFRQARCTRGCGWSFARMGGERDAFIEAVNRRCKDAKDS